MTNWDGQPRQGEASGWSKPIREPMSPAMIAAVADLDALIDRLENVAAKEAPIVRNTVRDALCHVQLGADLLDRLKSR